MTDCGNSLDATKNKEQIPGRQVNGHKVSFFVVEKKNKLKKFPCQIDSTVHSENIPSQPAVL